VRLHKVATVTECFAAGQYDQRLEAVAADEIGEIEAHLNQVAEQFAELLARSKLLVERNTRLEDWLRWSVRHAVMLADNRTPVVVGHLLLGCMVYTLKPIKAIRSSGCHSTRRVSISFQCCKSEKCPAWGRKKERVIGSVALSSRRARAGSPVMPLLRRRRC